MSKKRIFVSDLHMADRSGADDFNSPELFMRLLDYVESERSELILLGDIFELWQADLDKIFFYYSDIISRLLKLAGKIKVSLVVGNHDYIPFARYIGKTFGNINILEEYMDESVKLLAHHGQRYDPFNDVDLAADSIKEPLGQRIAWSIGLIERYLDPGIDEKLGGIVRRLQSLLSRGKDVLRHVAKEYVKREMARADDEFWQEVIRVRSSGSPGQFRFKKYIGVYEEEVKKEFKRGFRIVVIGHTHIPEKVTYGKNVYVNTGSWAGNSFPPVFVKQEGKQIRIFDARSYRECTEYYRQG